MPVFRATEVCGLVCERLAIIPISQPFLDMAVLRRLVPIRKKSKLGVRNIFSLHKHKCSLFHCYHRIVEAKLSAWFGKVKAWNVYTYSFYLRGNVYIRIHINKYQDYCNLLLQEFSSHAAPWNCSRHVHCRYGCIILAKVCFVDVSGSLMFVFKGSAHWFIPCFFLHAVSFACVVSLQELTCLVPLLSFFAHLWNWPSFFCFNCPPFNFTATWICSTSCTFNCKMQQVKAG